MRLPATKRPLVLRNTWRPGHPNLKNVDASNPLSVGLGGAILRLTSMSPTPATPGVFLSHSHVDKPVARRLVRRMTAHGINVWLDERELKLGAALTPAICDEIEQSDFLLVIASQASATSKWVGLELVFARAHDKAIVPFFIEPLSTHERFRDYLGVLATSPEAFADVVHGLMCDLYRSVNRELPPADSVVLTTGLRQLAAEHPNLAPLILGCLDGQGLHRDNLDTAFSVNVFAVDEALNALFDLHGDETMASHVASGFNRIGAGMRALSSWIAATGDGQLALVSAVGTPLDRGIISAAVTLLGQCNPPNNHALYNFIHHNAAQLDSEQRRAVIRLATWPVRVNTDRLGDVLGWVAFKAFPEAGEIQQMWTRWIYSGSFDGRPSAPADLARYLADAQKEGLPGWYPINDALRNHVRSQLRSRDKEKVITGLHHVQAAAEEGAPVLARLLRDLEGVSGTAEWKKWAEEDAVSAEFMRWYAFEVAKEATGERNWLRAWQSAERMVAFELQRRRILNG